MTSGEAAAPAPLTSEPEGPTSAQIPLAASQPAADVPSLRFREKLSYALGDAGSNFIYKAVEFFLLFFYTDVFGITPLQAGTLFLVARICDAVTDPLMGAVADRTSSRWGQFRPYLLFGAVPLGVLSILTWQSPSLSSGYRLAYAYVTYVLMMTAYTVVNIPYSALMGVMTPNSQERTSLSSYRFVGAFAAALVVQFATMRLVEAWGGGSHAWALTMSLFSTAAVICSLICFWGTRERIPKIDRSQHLGKEAKAVLSNLAWRCLAFLGVLVIANFAIRGAAFAYYFKYYVGDVAFLGMTSHEELLGAFLTSAGVANVAGVFTTSFLSRRFGKKESYIALTIVGSLLALPLFWLSSNQLHWVFSFNLLASFVMGPTAPLLFAMYGDVADDVELRSGRRATGLVYAGSLFSLKMGGALGGFLAGVLLTAAGYVAGQQQSPVTLQAIVSLVSLLPAALGVLALLVLVPYPLSKQTVANNAEQLRLARMDTI